MQNVYFTHIATYIAEQLNLAKHQIIVHTPWLTNDSLFNILLEKAENGIEVQLVIEENSMNSLNNFNKLTNNRVILHLIDTKLQTPNYESFAVIDQKITIFGNYSWTDKPDHTNRESIFIQANVQIAQQYLLRFETNTQQKSTSIPTTPQTTDLLDLTLGLRLKIQLLEAAIASVLEETASIESLIEQFVLHVQLIIYPLVLQKLELEQSLAAKKAQFTKKIADQIKADEKQQDYQNTKEKFANDQERHHILTQNIDTDLLRKLYREAAFLTHPDRFQDNDALAQKANDLMAKLSKAYKDKDLDMVQSIWQSLKDGIAFGFEYLQDYTNDNLSKLINLLENKKETLLLHLNALKTSETYQTLCANTDWDAYAKNLSNQLLVDIELLKTELAN